jgi:hypothetical protein
MLETYVDRHAPDNPQHGTECIKKVRHINHPFEGARNVCPTYHHTVANWHMFRFFTAIVIFYVQMLLLDLDQMFVAVRGKHWCRPTAICQLAFGSDRLLVIKRQRICRHLRMAAKCVDIFADSPWGSPFDLTNHCESKEVDE